MSSLTSAAEPATATARQRWAPFFAAFGIIFSLMLLWSIASPLMSSPDEPAHAIRAEAVVRGQLSGTPVEGHPGAEEVMVPRYVADPGYVCYAFKPSTSAACQPALTTSADTLVEGQTTATLNTPLFYYLAGLPSLVLSGHTALYAMRIMVALMSAVLLAIVFMMIRQQTRSTWSLVSAAVAVTPMVLFLSGTLNPNPVEACAAAALFTTLAITLRTPSSRAMLWERAVLIAFSTLMLVSTRSISLVWLLCIAVIALILANREQLVRVFTKPAAWVGAGLSGTFAILALWFFMLPKPGTIGDTSIAVGAGTDWKTAFVRMIDKALDYDAGVVGYFGWLDTPAPTITYAIWIVAIGALLLLAGVVGSARYRIALLLWALVALFLPAIVQAALVFNWGWVWQGRYILAAFMCLVITAGITVDAVGAVPPTRTVRRGLVTVSILLAFAQLAAFVYTLRRYVVSGTGWRNMIFHPEWQPPLGWITLCVLFACVLTVGVLVLHREFSSADTSRGRVIASRLAA